MTAETDQGITAAVAAILAEHDKCNAYPKGKTVVLSCGAPMPPLTGTDFHLAHQADMLTRARLGDLVASALADIVDERDTLRAEVERLHASRVNLLAALDEYAQLLADPPPPWATFGTHADEPGNGTRLVFWGTGPGGLPVWEREA